MTVTFRFDPGGSNEITRTGDDIVSYDFVKTHTGKGDFKATLAYDRALDDYAQRQDRLDIEIEGSVEWTGYCITTSHSERGATTTLTGDGIAKKLEETRPDYDQIGGPVVYDNVALDDAIRDYWGRTPFFNYSVTNQSTTQVGGTNTLQSADTTTEFNNIVSIAADIPVSVNSGTLEREFTTRFQEAETANNNVNQTTINDSAASDGQAINLFNLGDTASDNSLDLDYTIPQNYVGVAARRKYPNPGSNPEYTISVDGETFETVALNASTTGQTDWDWITQQDKGTQDLTAGNHTVTVEVTQETAGTDAVSIDCIALYDTRYPPNFDNSVDANGYLSGPELAPGTAVVEFSNVNTSFNINEATGTVTTNDTEVDKIQLNFIPGIDPLTVDAGTTKTISASTTEEYATVNVEETGTLNVQENGAVNTNDGARWKPHDGTELDTTSVTAQPDGVSQDVQGRVGLGGFGTRTTATPTNEYQAENLDTWTLTAIQNDRVVIDELTLHRNHFENLKTLHDYGNFLWVIEHGSASIDNLVVSSFQEGDETRSQPAGFTDQANKQSRVKADNYFNSVYVQGALDANGDRPSAEAKDSTAISNDGREISPGVLRDPDIVSEAGATFRAESILETALKNNELVGTVTTVPITTNPGYQRDVDFGTGNVKRTVEEITLTESNGQAQAIWDFTSPNDLSDDISELKRNQRAIGNRI